MLDFGFRIIPFLKNNDFIVRIAIDSITLVVLFFTAAFICWQAWLLSRSVYDAKEKESRELRAYVHVKIGNLIGVDDLNGWMDGNGKAHSSSVNGVWIHNPPRLRYSVVIENHGQTPAYWVTTSIGVVYDAWPFPQRPEVRNIPTLEHVERTIGETRVSNSLPPHQGGAVDLVGVLEDVKWDQAHTPPLRGMLGEEPTAAIYVFGFVGYKDVFKKTRVTHFRFAHIVDDETRRFMANGITQHPDGNEAT